VGIPETQLDTWSHQGSVTQSKNTYATIRKALERDDAAYAGREFEIFLQGSYGNDTNIYAESDVDVVIQLNSTFKHDLEALSKSEQDAFRAAHSDAAYGQSEFRKDVAAILGEEFGSDVKPGDKAIKVVAGGARRNADVIAALQFRKYHQFSDIQHQDYTPGICLVNSSGQLIVNYPKLHSKNLTVKHKGTASWLKPVVRIFKNMRSWLIENKRIEKGSAPSYYVEGLLYNVPNSEFGVNYETTIPKCLNWLSKHNRDLWVCANERYKLIHPTSLVTWRDDQCSAFISAAIKMWNDW
jgi:hypothetical protein